MKTIIACCSGGRTDNYRWERVHPLHKYKQRGPMLRLDLNLLISGFELLITNEGQRRTSLRSQAPTVPVSSPSRPANGGPLTFLHWEKGRVAPEVRFWPAIVRFLGYDPGPSPQALAGGSEPPREAEDLPPGAPEWGSRGPWRFEVNL